MNRKKLDLSQVGATFSSEFSFLTGKFKINDLTLDIAESHFTKLMNNPGVYVFWNEAYGVIKVGKSQSNAKLRALQHIRDNTRNDHVEMSSLKNDSKTHLILFNITILQDIHWILSLEYFMEKNLYPIIPSDRSG